MSVRHYVRDLCSNTQKNCLDLRSCSLSLALSLFLLCLSKNVYHFTSLIGTTSGTHSVWKGWALALWTSRKGRSLKCVMGSAVRGMRPRVSHVYNHSESTIPYIPKKVKPTRGQGSRGGLLGAKRLFWGLDFLGVKFPSSRQNPHIDNLILMY